MYNNNSEATIVSFFSGYGGLEKGISAALGGNTRVLADVERDAFPVANLVAKMEQGLMDAAPVFTDVTKFPYREFRGLVDIACGGVPCQPHSHAGKRKGGADERFLFDVFCEGMAEMRPGIVLIENVEGLLSSKMPDGSLCIRYILNQLENIGYCVENRKGQPLIGIFSASEVGAPHQRKRVFTLAYDKNSKRELTGTTRTRGTGLADGSDELALRDSIGRAYGESKEQPAEARFHAQRDPAAGGGEDVAHQLDEGLQGHAGDGDDQARQGGGGADRPVAEGGLPIGANRTAWPSRPGCSQYGWEPPRVVGNANGGGGALNGSLAGSIGQTESRRENELNKTSERGGQTQPPLGRVLDGTAPGLDLSRHTGLSDSELAQMAEVEEWLTKGTNRTDELRMCGNGVVPQTAELAFRTLYKELIG